MTDLPKAMIVVNLHNGKLSSPISVPLFFGQFLVNGCAGGPVNLAI
jgi:hypothetical protein